MTRRTIYFYDKVNSNLYVTPEFNGDKEEFIKFSKRGDSCDKNWNEILEKFKGVKTLEEFKRASAQAQRYYHSCLGDEILPIKIANEITQSDEVYMINSEGELYLYNPKELDRNYIMNIAGKGKFEYKNLTMKIDKEYSKLSECNIYTLEIDAIENISTIKRLHLGATEDTEVTANLEDFLESNINSYIKLVEAMKNNLKKEPLRLELITSPNNNFTVGFQSEKGNKYALSPRKDCFELIKIDMPSREPDYNLNSPIHILGKNLYPIFDCWFNEPIYDLSQIDIEALEMAEKISSCMTIRESIFDAKARDIKLNEIYENIYNKEKIESSFFEKYQDDEYIQELRERYYDFLENKEVINEIPIEESEEIL